MTAVTFMLAVAGLGGAQGAAQVGDLYVGTCDSVAMNTQQNQLDVYSPTGDYVTLIHGPQENACLTAMTFDTGDHLHIISAGFGTQAWNLLEFDNSGDLLSTHGPFASPTSVTHDLQGNLYIGQGSILKLDRSGHLSTYAVAGGAVWIDMAPDQRTIFYTATNGDVKTFDVVSGTQGPDAAVEAMARNVRALADGTIMFNSLGTVQRWSTPCPGCPFRQKAVYQIPANSDSFTLDPDGTSFWSINTYYDNDNQLGHADIYRTDIKTGNPLGGFSLQPLTGGRYYSMSVGVNGDGMGSSAVAPVFEKGATRRSVYLPNGTWYDWWTGSSQTGGKWISKDVDLSIMPIYVRAGAILPFDPIRQFTGEAVQEPTTLRIYPGADGDFTLYEDDGISLDYLKGQAVWIHCSWDDTHNTLTMRPGAPAGVVNRPVQKVFRIRVMTSGVEKTIHYKGVEKIVQF